jgi:hypothetical protein
MHHSWKTIIKNVNQKNKNNETFFIPGVPASSDALAIPSPFCHPEQQQQQPQSPPTLSLTPPPCLTNHLVPSGFLMHSTLNKNKESSKQQQQRKPRNTNSNR